MLRRRLLTVLSATVLSAACSDTVPARDANERHVEPLTVATGSGEHHFMVEIADEATERTWGLMFRHPLPDDRGMLFQFPDVAERRFWMRNTPSSLDIIYIDPKGRIVSVAKRTTPESDTVVPSYGLASGVLELRAGRADEIGVKAGDRVHHPFFAK